MPYKRLLRVVDEFPTRLLVGVLLSLAVITTGYIWWSVHRFEAFVHCQAEWSGDLLEYQTANDRSQDGERAVARLESRILNQLVQDLIDSDEDAEEEAALEMWQESREMIQERQAQLEFDRRQNPLPEPPLEVCNGGAGEGDIAD